MIKASEGGYNKMNIKELKDYIVNKRETIVGRLENKLEEVGLPKEYLFDFDKTHDIFEAMNEDQFRLFTQDVAQVVIIDDILKQF